MIRSDSELLDAIHELVTDQLETGARGFDKESLQKLLESDKRARQLYVQYMQESYHIRSRLVADPAGAEGVAFACTTTRRPSNRQQSALAQLKQASPKLLSLAAIAASLLLCCSFWFYQNPVKQDAPTISTASSKRQLPLLVDTAPTVATLLKSSATVWSSSGDRISELSRLSIGQELRLDVGSAELVFDTGVEALLLAPAQLKILGADRVSSEYGRFSARVGSNGVGFVIETPMARVTDLGTEFGVSIAKSGQTEVAVFEGEVDLDFGSADVPLPVTEVGTRERLLQGEAVRIDSSGARTRVESVDDSHLPSVRQLPPVYQRLPAIGTVRDNISEKNPTSRKFYRIVNSGFREDCQAFVDRPHQWNGLEGEGLPSELVGADYVMPFNDDKFASDLEVEVSVTRPATFYVFVSDNVDVPDWLLKDFEDTGRDIGLDEGRNRFRPTLSSEVGPGKSIDTIFSVWEREISSPQTVVLKSLQKPELKTGYNMYGIAVVGK